MLIKYCTSFSEYRVDYFKQQSNFNCIKAEQTDKKTTAYDMSLMNKKMF